jgi:hypothetical protein
MADVITDPELLKRLNAAAAAPAPDDASTNVVTDPALLERLKVASTEQAAPLQRSWAGKAASFLGAPDPNAPPDASGVNATIGRVATGVVGGIPDLAIKIQNAKLNPFDMVGAGVDRLLGTQMPETKIPEVTPLLRQATGTPELPADASGARRLLEGAATVAAGGGAQGVGRAIAATVPAGATAGTAAILPAVAATARNIVAPVVGSEVGGAVGEKLGGERGQVLGSLLGGLAGSAPSPSSLVERYYGRQARPDAADIAAKAKAEGITPTAGMLGNEKIQDIERGISGKGTAFLSNPVVDARERTLVQMREAADRAAADRGAAHPSPTPGTIGEHVLDTAEQTARGLRGESSAAQQALMDRVGPQSPVNVAGTYAALKKEIGSVSPDVAKPMLARLDALEQMMPRDQTGRVVVGPGGEINIPYERMKSWRSNLGRTTQTQESLATNNLKQVYGPATDAMRETAISRGVTPAEFDAAMEVTRTLKGSGGPVRYFEKIAGKEGTSGGRVGGLPPERAFNRVVDEQNPEGLQRLEQHAPQALDRIAGDTLRLRTQETLGHGGTGGTGAPIEGIRGGGAAGARRFADWWASMSPEAQRILGGNRQGTMQNLSELSGAFNYPTRQTGLSRAMGAQLGGIGGRFAVANVLGQGAQALGLPKSVGWGAGYFGLAPVLNYLHGRMLESGAARRGMSGDYSTTATPTIADLIAQLTAAGNANR